MMHHKNGHWGLSPECWSNTGSLAPLRALRALAFAFAALALAFLLALALGSGVAWRDTARGSWKIVARGITPFDFFFYCINWLLVEPPL